MGSRNMDDRQASLSSDLRRQIRTPANARFLGALPSFKVERELPRDLAELLQEIDHAEQRYTRHMQRA